MKRPDKWDKKARKVWGSLIANPFHVLRRDEKAIRKLAAALRRTDAAAEKRGWNKRQRYDQDVRMGKVRP